MHGNFNGLIVFSWYL